MISSPEFFVDLYQTNELQLEPIDCLSTILRLEVLNPTSENKNRLVLINSKYLQFNKLDRSAGMLFSVNISPATTC